MIMCVPIKKVDIERESMRENLDTLLECIEIGEKKLCKLFKKIKPNGNINKTTK